VKQKANLEKLHRTLHFRQNPSIRPKGKETVSESQAIWRLDKSARYSFDGAIAADGRHGSSNSF
jgi:hypothetical protein